MKTKQTALIVLLGVIAFVSSGYKNSSGEFDYGHVENGKYLNSFFNFEITLPEGWDIRSKAGSDSLLDTGKELFAGDDSEKQEMVKGMEKKVHALITVYQYPTESAPGYNPSIMLIAENLKATPWIKTGKQYLEIASEVMKKSEFKYDHIDKKYSKEVIDGVDFYRMNTSVKYAGINIKQSYYCTIVKKHCLSAIITYVNDKQKQELLKAIKSIHFKN